MDVMDNSASPYPDSVIACCAECKPPDGSPGKIHELDIDGKAMVCPNCGARYEDDGSGEVRLARGYGDAKEVE